MSGPHTPPSATLAPRRVPEAYVRSEIASYPLVSLTAFRSAMVELNPELDPRRGEPTRALWQQCEQSLSEHASGWSLDRLIIARNFFWFGEVPGRRRISSLQPVSMLRYLRNLAQSFLEPRSGVTEVLQSFEVNAFEASMHYRWLTFALPEDLLLSSMPVEPAPSQVDVEPPLLLRRLVDTGTAEIHHHVGAGMDFSILWASLLARLADPTLSHKELESPGLPFETGEVMMSWVLTAAVVRCVLAEFCIRRESIPSLRLQGFVDALGHSPAWPIYRLMRLYQAIQALSHGRDSELPEFYRLKDLYGQLHPVGSTLPSRPIEKLEEVWRYCDPISIRLGLHTPNGGERWLMRQGLRYLVECEQEEHEQGASPGSADPFFRRLFWQVLRIRCVYYRTVVQRPLTAGLQWFVRFYDRLRWASKPLYAARAEVSFHVAGRSQHLSALEVRIGPALSSYGLAEELWTLTRSWKHVIGTTDAPRHGRREPEFGVLIHFIKEHDPGRLWAAGVPPAGDRRTHAEPRPDDLLRPGGRYADFFENQAVRARAMVELVRNVPSVLWLLRGLDVASYELGEPTWVMVPLYRYVQAEANLAATTAAAWQGRHSPPPLRLTAHVGEDFRHLMEGLRRIFECIQYLLTRSGGRLGHATALGVEPRLWAESSGSVMMTAEDWLWDLIFEWRLYSSYRIAPELRAEAPPGRPEQVENRIRELSSSIFRHSYEPQVLAEVHHVLHQLFCAPIGRVRAEGSLDAFARAVLTLDPEHIRYFPMVRKILLRYREDEQVFQRGQEPVDITLDASEVAALYSVQNALRRGVEIRGLVVEINPSSNLLIGDLLDLRNHPILRLNPPEPQGNAPPPVPIAVGSDDPITFSTWLMREYSLLHEAALIAGYSERVAYQWLDRIRRTGLDARFTVAWLPTARDMADRLMRELGEYLQRSSIRS
ncbi:hypothetical protein [Hyalangium rubrum]|uniref:Adenosine deaminase domain-containing protein n=1 Tax=Hyalangium rubrum TaxID=3103134 RepID=A0ABU5H9P8_9BACT|nr:hypothetical protein [Hyalangium sp. s54d21]MDY7230036.1 hypothetical protein [Hyalangium sp. s54d21]